MDRVTLAERERESGLEEAVRLFGVFQVTGLTTASAVAPFRMMIPSTRSGFSETSKRRGQRRRLSTWQTSCSRRLTASLLGENFDEVQMLPDLLDQVVQLKTHVTTKKRN